jgi:hypothetical protein
LSKISIIFLIFFHLEGKNSLFSFDCYLEGSNPSKKLGGILNGKFKEHTAKRHKMKQLI